MQQNNEAEEKFLQAGRVLDFAVCLRVLRVEEDGAFVHSIVKVIGSRGPSTSG